MVKQQQQQWCLSVCQTESESVELHSPLFPSPATEASGKVALPRVRREWQTPESLIVERPRCRLRALKSFAKPTTLITVNSFNSISFSEHRMEKRLK